MIKNFKKFNENDQTFDGIYAVDKLSEPMKLFAPSNNPKDFLEQKYNIHLIDDINSRHICFKTF
jgi:hypothetical protein